LLPPYHFPPIWFIDGRIRSRHHEEAGVGPATAFLDRLNVHTLDGYDVRRQVLGLVAHHLKPGMFHQSATPVGDGAFRRLAQKVDLELLAISLLATIDETFQPDRIGLWLRELKK